MHSIVPSSSFHIETICIATYISRLFEVINSVDNLIVEVNLIDRDFRFSRMILSDSRKERLGEVEAWKPKHVGSFSLGDPILEHINSARQVLQISHQGLQGRV